MIGLEGVEALKMQVRDSGSLTGRKGRVVAGRPGDGIHNPTPNRLDKQVFSRLSQPQPLPASSLSEVLHFSIVTIGIFPTR